MDNDDEGHGTRLYVLQDFRQRNIPKFQVQVYEYKLEIDLQQRNQTYTWMLQTLPCVLQGRFFSTHEQYVHEVYCLSHGPTIVVFSTLTFIVDIINELTESVMPHDRVHLTITSWSLHHEIWLPFMMPEQLMADRIMVEI